MKKLFRVIFYIPKLLLQFIWNLIWAIFKLALVLALIGYGLVYYANNSSSTLATNINQAFHQVELGFSGTSTSDVEKVVSNLSTTDTIPESVFGLPFRRQSLSPNPYLLLRVDSP